MDLEFKNRDAFQVCGYCVETSLETCGTDLAKLWQDFAQHKEELFELFGYRKDFYGLMWLTENSRYCYLIGIETDKPEKAPEGTVCKQVPTALYAVLYVEASRSAYDAWTDYYEEILPNAGYLPNTGHRIDFEYYPGGEGEAYELWTPVIKKE
jgi:AraC family transcriptional regulator